MSSASGNVLKVQLTAPQQPVKVAVGTSFPVGVDVLTSLSQLEAVLQFDAAVLEKISVNACRCHLGIDSSNSRGEVNNSAMGNMTYKLNWDLRVISKPKAPTPVLIEVRGQGCIQQAQFQVEVV